MKARCCPGCGKRRRARMPGSPPRPCLLGHECSQVGFQVHGVPSSSQTGQPTSVSDELWVMMDKGRPLSGEGCQLTICASSPRETQGPPGEWVRICAITHIRCGGAYPFTCAPAHVRVGKPGSPCWHSPFQIFFKYIFPGRNLFHQVAAIKYYKNHRYVCVIGKMTT